MAHPTAEQMSEILAQVRDFRDRSIAPNVVGWERDRVMALQALRDASQLGLLAMEVPAELGGLDLSFRQKLEVIDCLSEVSMPFAFSLVNTANITSRVAKLGTAEHRAALGRLGATPHHRRSFAPVRAVLESDPNNSR